MKLCRRLLASGLAALIFASLTGPAAAEDTPLVVIYDQALVALTEELSFLVLLDRIEEPVPLEAASLPGMIGLFALPTEAMEQELEYLDQDFGPDVLAELLFLGESLEPAVITVLSQGPSLTEGRVDARTYLIAYDHLLDKWATLGGLSLDPFELGPPGARHAPEAGLASGIAVPLPVATTVPTTVPPATAAPTTSPETSAAPTTSALNEAPTNELSTGTEAQVANPSAERSLAWVAPVGSGVVAVLALALLLFRRRRTTGVPAEPAKVRSTGPSRDEILDAGRRILAAKTIGELASLVVERAKTLSDSDGAIFVFGDDSLVAGIDPGVPPDVVARVRSTGCTISSESLSIVPVATDGVVMGVLATSGEHIGVLQDLAPLVGAGLSNVTSRQETEAMAFVDGLTGVNNRRRFDIDLGEMSRVASAGGIPVAVAMLDVDHFKMYNDANGHQAGDTALQQIAQLIEVNVRGCDIVYRYGGEEFAALLPGASLEEAQDVVERVRLAIQAEVFDGASSQPDGRITMSVGVATTFPADGNAMLLAADAALYAAKTRGRNQVVVAPGPDARQVDETV